MTKKNKEHSTEVQRLRKENQKLKSINRHLKRENKKLNEQNNKYEEAKEELFEKECEEQFNPPPQRCEACARGELIETDIGIRVLITCTVCDFREVKKNVEKH